MNIDTNTNNSKGPSFYRAAWLPLHPQTTSARHVLHTSTCSLSSKIFLQIQIKNKCKSKYKYSDAWLPHHPYIASAYPHLLCLIPTRYIPCGWHPFPPLFVKWHMYVVCCLEVYVHNFIVIFNVLRCWNPDSEHTKKATNIKMNDYTDTWAGHTIYTCLNVYLGPKRCLWKHATFICQSFKFRLWIKHPPLTAKRISFLLFGLTFYRYARISSKFLRYVRGRISQIWQWAARWNWHRSRPFVLFSRTHLGILKRFRGIHTQGPWQRSTLASFPSTFKQKDVLVIES